MSRRPSTLGARLFVLPTIVLEDAARTIPVGVFSRFGCDAYAEPMVPDGQRNLEKCIIMLA
jgi:hypothetical protein